MCTFTPYHVCGVLSHADSSHGYCGGVRTVEQNKQSVEDKHIRDLASDSDSISQDLISSTLDQKQTRLPQHGNSHICCFSRDVAAAK